MPLRVRSRHVDGTILLLLIYSLIIEVVVIVEDIVDLEIVSNRLIVYLLGSIN